MKRNSQERSGRTKQKSSFVGRRRDMFAKKIHKFLLFHYRSLVEDCKRTRSSLINGVADFFKRCFPRFWRKMTGFEHIRNGSFEEFSESTRQAILPKDALGREGERVVFDYIKKKPGCEVVACNAENYYCELDLIYLDKPERQIVFVEVKTRRHDYVKYPAFRAVDAKRRKKMALAAELFIKERGYFHYSMRFDVAVVVYPLDSKPTIKYYRNAFTFKYAMVGYKKDDFGKTRRRKPGK